MKLLKKTAMLFLLALSLVLCSCSGNLQNTNKLDNTPENKDGSISEIRVGNFSSGELQKIYNLEKTPNRDVESAPEFSVDNSVALQDGLKTEYDIHDIAKEWAKHGENNVYFGNLSSEFPDFIARRNSANSFYMIYRIKQGGLLFAFAETVEQEDYAIYDTSSLPKLYYVTKPLSMEDFSSIQVGSNFDEVLAIDPGAQIKKNVVDSEAKTDNTDPAKIVVVTDHYLTDGVIQITSEIKDGVLTVTRVYRSEDYMLKIFGGQTVYIDGSILPEDMQAIKDMK